MKKIVRYTSYEGSSVDQLFVGADIFSIEAQEEELDEHYYKCYGIGGFTDNDVLLNFMATIVKFVEIDKEKTGTVKLKDLL